MNPSRRVRDERRWALRTSMERRRQRSLRIRLTLIALCVVLLLCIGLLVLLHW